MGALATPLGGSERLIIPIETKAREFHSKLLLASVAAEKGIEVILGGAETIRRRLHELPRGFFLDKSVAPTRAALFTYYRSVGHRIVAWCEEGLTLGNPEEYLLRKINAEALRQSEVFFAWGPYQAELIRKRHPALADRVLSCGNPRVDLLRPELHALFADEARHIRERHGSFILVNTNFGLCNHMKGEGAFIRQLKEAGKITGEKEEAFCRGWVDYKAKIFEAFKEMLRPLSEGIGKSKIVVRPHPSEDHSAWHHEAANLPNVEVIFEGSVVPWLLAAEAVVHNGCTTGIEAYLLGRPVIAYVPRHSDIYDVPLPNELSRQASSPGELADLVGEAGAEIDERSDEEEKKRLLVRRYLGGLDGPLASDIIIDTLLDRVGSGGTSPARKLRTHATRFYVRTQRFVERLWRQHEERSDYGRQKFPGLTLREVEAELSSLVAATGRFGIIRATPMGEDCFVLRMP